MEQPKLVNDPDGAQSRLSAGLGLMTKIEAHLQQLAPHMMQRDGVVLLREAREEIYRLREAILVQLCETEDSEYMTGAQRNQFAAPLERRVRLNFKENEMQTSPEICELSDAILSVSETKGWNAVTVTLPDEDICVLIALADGEVWTGYLDDGVWCYLSADLISCEVTHWMNLPEPPNVQIEGQPAYGLSRSNAGLGLKVEK